ncbi:hypothetical protein [Deinococcus peraridilitoris]|uniref:Uncharacterized protein n=1 Tax=Deinococcus peraridilitoris (strain DSM 19664 / LMG 22246 / CIP 109416 / KR-200) TaxID=937777 RepID=K9ZYP7_DEIPD|nr:hypothetical protein [Deinococcus peraridilitoris]AFZ66047.1 hypothetical protein Deipe_0451 [Deinococcus peraridilitoris DSM 19664]
MSQTEVVTRPELTLTLKVPETDFDGVDLTLALQFIIDAKQHFDRYGGSESTRYGLWSSYKVLHRVMARYAEALGDSALFGAFPDPDELFAR